MSIDPTTEVKVRCLEAAAQIIGIRAQGYDAPATDLSVRTLTMAKEFIDFIFHDKMPRD